MATKFRRAWIWTTEETDFYREKCIGRTIHVCCGVSSIGDVRVDIEPQAEGVIKADYRNLPYPDQSFDTALCDPPWGKREQVSKGLSWLYELSRVSRKRVIIIHNTIFVIRGWKLVELWAVQSKGTLFWAVCQIHEPI